MSRPHRALRIAVGTALFAIGACNKDKAATETPEATETTNVGPNGEPTEKTNVGPEETTEETTNVGPTGEPAPTTNTGPATPPK
jgi:hypothetical protein